MSRDPGFGLYPHVSKRGADARGVEVQRKKSKFEAGRVPCQMPNATRCQLPPGSRLRGSLLRIDYLDSFEVPSRTPEQDVVLIYAAAFGHLPKVFKQLPVLRSRLVKPLGIAGVSYADLARQSTLGAITWSGTG